MSLVPPILDNRRFEDLRLEALERVQQTCPEWTDFNPSDPGVTLIELFAWFTDLMLFRMNMIPDKLQGELLDLIGVRPEPAKPAEAMIVFERTGQVPPAVDASAKPPIVPKGTASLPINIEGNRVVFETEGELSLVDGSLVAIVRDEPGQPEVDLTQLNKLANRGFDPFGPGGGRGNALRLDIKAAKDASVEAIFPDVMTLRVTRAERVIREGDKVPPSDDLARRPPAPSLAWEALSVAGAWTPITVIDDQTRGFERDGFIRLGRPRRPISLSVKDGQIFQIRCRVEAPGFAYGRVPRLVHIALNAVSAIAQETLRNEVLDVSSGVAGQVFTLQSRPVVPDSLRIVTNLSQNEGASGQDEIWQKASDLSQAEPDAARFLLDAAAGTIRFGDGKHGKIPAAGRRVIARRYRAGGGEFGNVKAKAIKMPFGGRAWEGTNPFPAAGGADAEPADGLRQRAPARLRSLDRAVIPSDYEDLARRKGRMARALAVPLLNPDFPELSGKMPGVVTVFVVAPARSDNRVPPWPTDGELDEVTRILDAARTVGTELFVRAADLRPVRVVVEGFPTQGVQFDRIAPAVSQALNDWLNSEERAFGTLVVGGDLWSCVAQAKVGTIPAIQVERLTATVAGCKPIIVGPDQKGEGISSVRIPPHAVVWGRPDHTIVLKEARRG